MALKPLVTICIHSPTMRKFWLNPNQIYILDSFSEMFCFLHMFLKGLLIFNSSKILLVSYRSFEKFRMFWTEESSSQKGVQLLINQKQCLWYIKFLKQTFGQILSSTSGEHKETVNHVQSGKKETGSCGHTKLCMGGQITSVCPFVTN